MNNLYDVLVATKLLLPELPDEGYLERSILVLLDVVEVALLGRVVSLDGFEIE